MSETAQRDYYEVLGLAKDADQKAIKDAFRHLALKYHPDRNKDADAEERFKEVAQAYAILSNPVKRANYDERGLAGIGSFSDEDLFGSINFADIFGGLNFDFGGNDLFGGLFARHGSYRGPQRGANIEVNLTITLERVASGGDEVVRFKRLVTCSACHGTGAAGGTVPRKCDVCGGSGRNASRQTQDNEHVLIQRITTCAACHGKGTVIDALCPDCQGSGQGELDEMLAVKIPRGVGEGMVLRVSGKGMPSPEAGGRPGDLFVIVHSAPDPRFERAGADLLHRETIALTDAVLGTSLDVQTFNGSVPLVIPPGTQPGTVLHLSGKGLPEFGSDRHGNLYLQITVLVPEKLSSEELALYEQLRMLARYCNDGNPGTIRSDSPDRDSSGGDGWAGGGLRR